jgi:hypothetical protein
MHRDQLHAVLQALLRIPHLLVVSCGARGGVAGRHAARSVMGSTHHFRPESRSRIGVFAHGPAVTSIVAGRARSHLLGRSLGSNSASFWSAAKVRDAMHARSPLGHPVCGHAAHDCGVMARFRMCVCSIRVDRPEHAPTQIRCSPKPHGRCWHTTRPSPSLKGG